jgi:tetratricopeptide (TPR) repeat protein
MKVGKSTAWLIKSGGNILGPYSDKQVADLLRDRMIVPLDEAAAPCSRWIYIRDHPKFATIIKEIRERSLGSINDDTTTQANMTATAGDTQTISTNQPDELTDDIVHAGSGVVQDILFHSIDDPVNPRSKLASDTFTQENDLFVRQQVEKSSRWIWALTTIALIFTLSFVVFKQFVAKPIQDKATVKESMDAGVDALEAGDYDTALEDFKKIYSLDPSDSSVYLYLGILMVQIENQPFQGRKILEKLTDVQGKNLKQVFTGIGLAYLKEGDYKSAEKYFNKALDIDPLFNPAVVNLGAAAFYQEDWPKASNHLQLSLKDGNPDGAEVIMLTQVLIKLFQSESEPRYLAEAKKYIELFLKKSRNYFLEVSVGEALISFLQGSKKDIYAKIDQILDLDTNETESHRQNLFIHRNISSWSLVAQWCLKITQDLEPNSHVIAFEAMCLMKSGDMIEANKKIDDALAQSPKDPLIQATYGLILQEMRAGAKTEVALDKALNYDSQKVYAQPRRLKARYCRQKEDNQCEKKYFGELLSIDPKSLFGLAGMAEVSLNTNDIAAAKKYLFNGLQISNGYRPFLPINKVISKVENASKPRGL